MIELVSVSKNDELSNKRVIKSTNLRLKSGASISIVGKKGSGKSTLLSLISLLEKPTDGEVYFLGEATSNISDFKRKELRRKYVGHLFSDPMLVREYTIFENIELPLLYLRVSKKNRKAMVEEILEEFCISELRSLHPEEIKVRDQILVSLARAFIVKPVIIVADEITNDLNIIDQIPVLNALIKINEGGTTVVLATQDKSVSNFTISRAVLENGKLSFSKLES